MIAVWERKRYTDRLCSMVDTVADGLALARQEVKDGADHVLVLVSDNVDIMPYGAIAAECWRNPACTHSAVDEDEVVVNSGDCPICGNKWLAAAGIGWHVADEFKGKR